MTLETVQEKDPDVAITYTLDWRELLVEPARRSYDFSVADVVRAVPDTGWDYECTTAGRTGRHYPVRWPRAAAQTLNDGSVVWTCKHPDNTTTPSVQSAIWTVPSGLTLDSQSESGALTVITLSGGTDGVDYEVTCQMTPSAGNPIERTILVPVRSQ